MLELSIITEITNTTEEHYFRQNLFYGMSVDKIIQQQNLYLYVSAKKIVP